MGAVPAVLPHRGNRVDPHGGMIDLGLMCLIPAIIQGRLAIWPSLTGAAHPWRYTMKKLILAAASATAIFALSACGGATEEPVDETVVETETVEPAPLPEATPMMEEGVEADPMATDPAADPMAT